MGYSPGMKHLCIIQVYDAERLWGKMGEGSDKRESEREKIKKISIKKVE